MKHVHACMPPQTILQKLRDRDRQLVVFPVHPVVTMRQNGGNNFLYMLQYDMRLSMSSLQAANKALAANEAAYRFATDALQT